MRKNEKWFKYQVMISSFEEQAYENERWLKDLERKKQEDIYLHTELSNEPTYHGFMDFRTGYLKSTLSRASIGWDCTDRGCFIEADIPIPEVKEGETNMEDVNIEDEGLKWACRITDVHEHGSETHVHLICRAWLKDLKWLIGLLINSVEERKIKISSKRE